MAFRMAFGRCSCRGTRIRPAVREACEDLLAYLEHVRSLGPDQLQRFSHHESEMRHMGGKSIHLDTYRETLPDGRTLIVVQTFVPTLRWPTFISTSGIGHILAEGLVVSGQTVEDAPDELLWYYR